VKQAILAVAAVVAIVSGVIFAISRTADVSPLDPPAAKQTDEQQAQQWEDDASAAFGGAELVQAVMDMVKGAREWQDGTRPAEQFRAELDHRRTQFAEMADRLAALRPYPFDPRVIGLYRDTAALYQQTVAVYHALVDEPAPDRRAQLDLLARRLRILGDRVFDRGRELIKPKLKDAANPDIEVRLPDEVPNWVAEGLAPGPPLDDLPPPPSPEPQLRRPTRPTQSRAAWLTALRQATSAIPAAPPQARARALIAAAELLRATPDPANDREEGARIRLALLVHADGARAAQLQLDAVARQLQVVGQHLWSGPDLPPNP
jgi:hypothetical protein